jgi:hypothetical protein
LGSFWKLRRRATATINLCSTPTPNKSLCFNVTATNKQKAKEIFTKRGAITEDKRLSGISEGVATAPYSATPLRRTEGYQDLRGGSKKSLLCTGTWRTGPSTT